MRRESSIIITIFIMISLIGVLTGCVPQYDQGSGREGNGVFEEGSREEEEGIEEKESKPFEERLFKEEGEGKVVLKTNDMRYWGVRGYTVWKFLRSVDKREPSIEVVKKGGAAEAGYGLICCSTKKEAGQKEYRMLVVMIHVDGKYSVGYAVNGKYKSLVWKQSDKRLKKGYGIANSISVKKEGKAVLIYFNDEGYEGEAAYRISNADEYSLGEGQAGVIGVISAKDRFPDDMVHIEYRIKR